MRHAALGFLACLAMTACGKEEPLPADLPGLETAAGQVQDQARNARAEKDPKKAAKADERGKKILEKSTALAGDAAEHKPALSRIRASSKETHRLAMITAEEAEIASRMSGIKAKAYRSGRKAALTGTFLALALAAEQEAKGGEVGRATHESAMIGADLSERFAGRANPTADWTGVSTDLRSLVEQDPAGLATYLACVLVLTRQDGLALIEIDRVDPKSLKDPGQILVDCILRGIILRLNGFPESAGETFMTAGLAATPEAAKGFGQELQAGIHLLLAADHIQKKEYEIADIEIVRAMKAWPDNPVAVFLTGERLAATGEREAAARSLEASVAGTDQEWIAKRVAARARELRDGQGPAEPLIYDSGILRDVALWFIWQAAKTSPTARKLQKAVDSARGFGSRWMPKDEPK